MRFRRKGEKSENWEVTTTEWKEEQRCKTVTLPNGQKGKFVGMAGDCCKFHRWQLFGPILQEENRGRIITSQKAEEYIKANGQRRGPAGELIVSTARGARRVAKKEKKK